MSCCGESPTVNSVQGLRRSYCLLGRTRCPQNTCRQQHSHKSCSCMPASYTKEKEQDEFSNMYAKDLTTHLLGAEPMTTAGWLTSPNMHKSRRRGPSRDARTATDGCQHVGRWDCFAHGSSLQASCMGTPGGHERKLHRSTKHSSCAAAAASRPCTVLHIHTNTVSRGTKRHI
jgi:hypothetical protein